MAVGTIAAIASVISAGAAVGSVVQSSSLAKKAEKKSEKAETARAGQQAQIDAKEQAEIDRVNANEQRDDQLRRKLATTSGAGGRQGTFTAKGETGGGSSQVTKTDIGV